MVLGFDISFPKGVLGRIHHEITALFASQPRVAMVHFWYQWGSFKPEWSAFVLRKEVSQRLALAATHSCTQCSAPRTRHPRF